MDGWMAGWVNGWMDGQHWGPMLICLTTPTHDLLAEAAWTLDFTALSRRESAVIIYVATVFRRSAVGKKRQWCTQQT